MRRMAEAKQWVALPIPDYRGRVDAVYGPFDSYEAAKAVAARLSTDPDECRVVPIEPTPWPDA